MSTAPITQEDLANVCKLLERLRTGEMNLIPSLVPGVESRDPAGKSEAMLERVEALLTRELRRMDAPLGDGGPAFPVQDCSQWQFHGMTLRDYFAIREPMPFDSESSGLTLSLMQVLMPEKQMPSLTRGSTREFIEWQADAVARYRYICADAMLKARQA